MFLLSLSLSHNLLLSASALSGWFVSCLVSCVSVGNISQPNSRGHFSLTDLHCGYFWRDTLRFIPRAECGPGGRAVHTELCSLSRKLIILFVTDNKYFMADSRQSHSAQIVLKDKNCKGVLVRNIYMITFLYDATYSRKSVYCMQS